MTRGGDSYRGDWFNLRLIKPQFPRGPHKRKVDLAHDYGFLGRLTEIGDADVAGLAKARAIAVKRREHVAMITAEATAATMNPTLDVTQPSVVLAIDDVEVVRFTGIFRGVGGAKGGKIGDLDGRSVAVRRD